MSNVFLTSALSSELEESLETKIAVHQIAFLQESFMLDLEKGVSSLDFLEEAGILRFNNRKTLFDNWDFSNKLQFWYLEKGSNKVDYYGSEQSTGDSFFALSLLFPSAINPEVKRVWASFTEDEKGEKVSVLMLPEDY